MNQHQSLRNAVAVALAVIITAGGISLVGSFVLCVGADGHADLEPALEVCCLDDDGPGGESGASRRLVDPCGGCADIGLDLISLTTEKQRLDPPGCTVLDAAGRFRADTAPMLDVDWGAESGPPSLEELQTVVLLT